jgi:hypothetical protein
MSESTGDEEADADAIDDSATASPLQAPTSTVAETPARRRRTTVTFYLSDALRNRARTAYRATSYEERDGSWSEMLTKALLAEVERRENEHNDGRPFTATDAPLTPGRPIGF